MQLQDQIAHAANVGALLNILRTSEAENLTKPEVNAAIVRQFAKILLSETKSTKINLYEDLIKELEKLELSEQTSTQLALVKNFLTTIKTDRYFENVWNALQYFAKAQFKNVPSTVVLQNIHQLLVRRSAESSLDPLRYIQAISFQQLLQEPLFDQTLFLDAGAQAILSGIKNLRTVKELQRYRTFLKHDTFNFLLNHPYEADIQQALNVKLQELKQVESNSQTWANYFSQGKPAEDNKAVPELSFKKGK